MSVTPPLNDHHPLLRNVLNNVINNKGITPESKAFLSDDVHIDAFLNCIHNSDSKDKFLHIEGMTPDIYENLRRILNEHKINDVMKIVAIRGRAGGLRLLVVENPSAPVLNDEQIVSVENESNNIDTRERTLEKEFYPIVRTWALEAGYESCEITGGKLPGFRWENPDLIVVDYSFNEIFRSINFDITSFEVKLKVEPRAVWQAAHYLKFSNEAYIAFVKSSKEVKDQDNGRVFNLAIELGLGVLAYENSKFIEIQSPRRNKPDQEMVGEFVRNFSSLSTVRQTIEMATKELDEAMLKIVSDRLNSNR